MPDTFPLGSIPPLSVWEGETLTFVVTTTLGEGASFGQRTDPTPAGKLSIEPKTGVFTYAPAPEDSEDFSVWIEARKDMRGDEQQFFITPHRRLLPEFNVIEHVSKTAPDPTSRLYMAYAEEDAGELPFNGVDKVMTKRATASGVKLVLESKGSSDWLHQKLKDRTDLKELILCADEVVVRCELKLPGTEVKIYARSLRFDDSAGETARIDTTPLPYKTRSNTEEGLDGQKGGDIFLFVRNLHTPGNAIRIIANGGQGEEARPGEKGADGSDVPVWDGKVRVERTDFDLSGDVRAASRDGSQAVGVDIYQQIPNPSRRGGTWKEVHREEYDTGRLDGVARRPSNGEEPKLQPGRPGQGGDGAVITSAFAEQLRPRVQLDAGKQGVMASDIPASAAGKPTRSFRLKFVYNIDIRGLIKVSASGQRVTETKPGSVAKAKPCDKAQPWNGGFRPLPAGDSAYWVQPAGERALIAYLEDAMLTGHVETESVQAMLADHLSAVKAVAGRAGVDLAWQLLDSELTALEQRIDGPYDYFGNPAGWVPMLSFQANLQLYRNELEVAVRTMFLAYWVENNQSRTGRAREALQQAIDRLRAETEKAIDSYRAAQSRLIDLDERSDAIKKELNDRKNDLQTFVERCKVDIRDDLKVEHFWRAAAKILGGVMELIPVGQPVLGALGKSATALSDIDLDNPTGMLPDLAGAWSTVAQEKIAPKFSQLLSQLTGAAEEEKKEESKFDQELAKKKLEERVKELMAEQKKAKDGLVAGFSGFAVSEADIKERLQHVLAQSPTFKTLTKDIEDLNKKKAAFAQDLFAVIEAIGQAAATIVKNQMALIELRAQLGSTLDKLNIEVLQYVQAMGQRARARLMLYKYYLLKSYHYLTLEPLPEIDFRAQKMFDAFAALLPESGNGMLTSKQYESLAVVFENELREIAQRIIAFYQTHKGRMTGTFTFELTRDQLEALNADPHRVDVDLLWMLDTAREDIRITGIETVSVSLAEPFPRSVVNIGLQYRHDGLSRLRRGGKLFLFRSGEYQVGANGDGGSAAGTRSDEIYWAADLTFNPTPRDGREKLTWADAKEDVEANSLVRYLIGDKGGDSPLLSFRPSAWTNLTIKRSGARAGTLVELKLKVHYVYYSVKDEFSTVVVRVADGAQPLIRCDKEDANSRKDGQGSFVRTFRHRNVQEVTLSALERYGLRTLQGWRLAEDPDAGDFNAGPVDLSKLTKGRELKLNLQRVHDHLVEPIFKEVPGAATARRRTRGIVSDIPSSDPKAEADVIMTAAALGFAADYLATNREPLQFDIDPLEKDPSKRALFISTVTKIDTAIAAYLSNKGLVPFHVRPGLSPGYWPGSMIMGVYMLAGQEIPGRTGTGGALAAPVLSEKGKALWEKIRTLTASTPQYRGRGAYTGFVDNKNTEGDIDPVGPRSTVRMVVPAEEAGGGPSVRWLPPQGHPLWGPRKRRDRGTYVAWGLIGGNEATKAPGAKNPTGAGNLADQIEREMRDLHNMVFVGEPTTADIATYTHGMIQALYKAYALGPSCVPYEIAVGDETKKMASCMGCTLFMYAVGYPPTSIHLGSAESWAPLYAPYNPNGPTEPNEPGVVRDFNNRWHERCREWLTLGLEVLDDAHTAEDHRSSRDAVHQYLNSHEKEAAVCGNLILDALTIHDSEVNRISRTLWMPPQAVPDLDKPATAQPGLPPPPTEYLDPGFDYQA